MAALALAFATSAGGTSGPGLYGLVTRGPTKPVCRAGEPCSEPAGRTKLRFFKGRTLVAAVVTDSRGRYRLHLPRGVYSVRAGASSTNGIGRGTDPATVRVRAAWRRQDFAIDTGIR